MTNFERWKASLTPNDIQRIRTADVACDVCPACEACRSKWCDEEAEDAEH